MSLQSTALSKSLSFVEHESMVSRRPSGTVRLAVRGLRSAPRMFQGQDEPCRGPAQPARTGADQPTPCWWIPWGRWMFRHRGRVFSPLGALLCVQALADYCQHAGQPAKGFSASFLTAFALVGLGSYIRVHVAGRARPGTSSRGVTFEAGQLVTTGMYAYVRNPLYLANLMIWAGLALLVAPAWWVGMFIGLAAFFYHCIVLAEEDFLLHRFGPQYLDYCARVGRWIPTLAFRQSGREVFCQEGRSSVGSERCSGFFLVRLSERDAASKTPRSGNGICFRRPDRQPGRYRTSEQNECKFTFRRALFREADSLMLILLAGWAFGSVWQGQLPWQVSPGVWGSFWTGLLGVAGIGWGWIKWLKKRSWPANGATDAAPVPSKPAGSMGS